MSPRDQRAGGGVRPAWLHRAEATCEINKAEVEARLARPRIDSEEARVDDPVMMQAPHDAPATDTTGACEPFCRVKSK